MKDITSQKIESIKGILDKVQEKPFFVECFIVDGFDFHVYFDNRLGYFRVKMFYTPGWGHSNGFSCKTKEEFLREMERMIKEAKIIFTEGGRYPENYYSRNK